MDITLPKSWQELNDKQLHYVLFLLSEGYTPDTVKAYVFFRLGHVDPDTVTPGQVAEVLPCLDWVLEPPDVPVRLAKVWRGTEARFDAYCHGMTFEEWLALDNWYTGFLYHSDKEAMARGMARILYGTDEGMTGSELLGAAYWTVGLKRYLSRRFGHLFKTVGADERASGDMRRRLQDAMDAQIRALTGGDITKREAVLHADMYTALTELDAKAEHPHGNINY